MFHSMIDHVRLILPVPLLVLYLLVVWRVLLTAVSVL